MTRQWLAVPVLLLFWCVSGPTLRAQQAAVLYDAEGFAPPRFNVGPLHDQDQWQTNADQGAGFSVLATQQQVTLQHHPAQQAIVSSDVGKMAIAWRAMSGAGPQDKLRVTMKVLLPAGTSGGLRRLNIAMLDGAPSPLVSQHARLEIIRTGTQIDSPYLVRSYVPEQNRSAVHAEVAGGLSLTITVELDYAARQFQVSVDDGQQRKSGELLSWSSPPDKSSGKFEGIQVVVIGEQRYNVRADINLADVRVERLAGK